mgnify:CR=1 FL=1
MKALGKKEEEILLEKKIASEDFLFDLKSKELNIPLKSVYPEDVPLKVLELKEKLYYRSVKNPKPALPAVPVLLSVRPDI